MKLVSDEEKKSGIFVIFDGAEKGVAKDVDTDTGFSGLAYKDRILL